MEAIKGAWAGEEELWKVIWVYGVFFIFLAKVFAVVLRLTTDVDFDNPTPSAAHSLIVCKVVYGTWFFISVWRCAFNVYSSFWGYLARGVLILYVMLFCAVFYLVHQVLDPFELLNRGVDYIRVRANIAP